MLHLLPQAYIEKLQNEYKLRVWVTICYLIVFCLVVLAVGLLPSFIIVKSQQTTLHNQTQSKNISITDEESKIALEFEAIVNQGMRVMKNNGSLSSIDIDQIVDYVGQGIVLNGIMIIQNAERKEVEVRGKAATRSDLSSFINTINNSKAYIVDEVPASTYTKYKDLNFVLMLKGLKNK